MAGAGLPSCFSETGAAYSHAPALDLLFILWIDSGGCPTFPSSVFSGFPDLFRGRKYGIGREEPDSCDRDTWIHNIFCGSSIPIFYEKEMDNIKYKTFEDVTEVYGKTNLCKICNIKQIITYAKLGVQPVWIDEGYGGKLIAYYFIPETKVAWKYWLENRPDTGQAKNAADRGGNRSGWE